MELPFAYRLLPSVFRGRMLSGLHQPVKLPSLLGSAVSAIWSAPTVLSNGGISDGFRAKTQRTAKNAKNLCVFASLCDLCAKRIAKPELTANAGGSTWKSD